MFLPPPAPAPQRSGKQRFGCQVFLETGSKAASCFEFTTTKIARTPRRHQRENQSRATQSAKC